MFSDAGTVQMAARGAKRTRDAGDPGGVFVPMRDVDLLLSGSALRAHSLVAEDLRAATVRLEDDGSGRLITRTARGSEVPSFTLELRGRRMAVDTASAKCGGHGLVLIAASGDVRIAVKLIYQGDDESPPYAGDSEVEAANNISGGGWVCSAFVPVHAAVKARDVARKSLGRRDPRAWSVLLMGASHGCASEFDNDKLSLRDGASLLLGILEGVERLYVEKNVAWLDAKTANVLYWTAEGGMRVFLADTGALCKVGERAVWPATFPYPWDTEDTMATESAVVWGVVVIALQIFAARLHAPSFGGKTAWEFVCYNYSMVDDERKMTYVAALKRLLSHVTNAAYASREATAVRDFLEGALSFTMGTGCARVSPSRLSFAGMREDIARHLMIS